MPQHVAVVFVHGIFAKAIHYSVPMQDQLLKLLPREPGRYLNLVEVFWASPVRGRQIRLHDECQEGIVAEFLQQARRSRLSAQPAQRAFRLGAAHRRHLRAVGIAVVASGAVLVVLFGARRLLKKSNGAAPDGRADPRHHRNAGRGLAARCATAGHAKSSQLGRELINRDWRAVVNRRPGREIDYQLDLRRLLNRQVGRATAFEKSTCIVPAHRNKS